MAKTRVDKGNAPGARAEPTLVVAMLACAAALSPAPAWAQSLRGAAPSPSPCSSEDARYFDVSAGPLLDALAAVADACGISVQMDARLAQGQTSAGVRGRLSVAQALRRLMEGTGLEARSEDGRTYVLQRAAGAPQSSAAREPLAPPQTALHITLPKVRVLGRPPASDWNDPASGAGGQMGGSALVQPQSLRTVPRALIDDLGATRLDGLLPYVAGASRQNDFGGTWDNIALRGFAGHEDTGMSLLRNGMQANRGYNAPRDVGNVESIDVLRGPMGALVGSSEPGGTLNLQTKAPSWTPAHSVEVGVGSFARRRAAVDLGGPWRVTDKSAGDSGNRTALAWRLNAVAEDAGSFRDHVRTRRTLLAPALAWKPAPGTLLRYDGERLSQQAPMDRGVVAINGQPGDLPVSRFYGEPDDGDVTIVNNTHQLLLDQELGTQWKLHAGLMWRHGTYGGRTTYGHGYGQGLASLNTTGWLWRQRRWRDFHSNDGSAQFELAGPWRPGGENGLEHRLLFGVETFRFQLDQRMQRTASTQWALDGINVYAPRHGLVGGAPQDFIDTHAQQRGQGFYLQDQLALAEGWTLLAGLRHDRFGQGVDDRLALTRTEQYHSATTPRLGLSWLASRQWAFYANLASSFRPNVGVNAQGEAFAPERGRSHELGLKWQSDNGRLGGTLAAFDTVKRNVLRTDPLHPDFSAASEQVRSQGLEAEMVGWLDPRWRIAFNASLLTQALPQFARLSGTLLLMHQQAVENGVLNLGFGLTHAGPRTGDSGAPLLPGYTLARLVARWQPAPPWTLSLDLDNVFDRSHYLSAYNDVWVSPGPPRAFRVSLRYTF